MKTYDPSCPLVFIHVPKTAGASVRRVFKNWFKERFVPHYFGEANGTLPQRSPLFDQHTPDSPVCVYGHFNQKRGFGVQDNYPDAQQFMTILRDPFEMAISGYYYMRNTGAGWKDASNFPQGDLDAYLKTMTPNMLGHFPRPVTTDTYKDIIDSCFVDIGFTEDLGPSLARMAATLGHPFDDAMLEHHNLAERDDQNAAAQELRAQFQDRHPLEFAVYDYARARFAPSIRPKEPRNVPS